MPVGTVELIDVYKRQVKVVSFSAKELKKNARLIAAVNKKLSEGAPGIDTPLAGAVYKRQLLLFDD